MWCTCGKETISKYTVQHIFNWLSNKELLIPRNSLPALLHPLPTRISIMLTSPSTDWSWPLYEWHHTTCTLFCLHSFSHSMYMIVSHAVACSWKLFILLLDHFFIWWILLISFSHLWLVHIESFPVCMHTKSFQSCLTLRDLKDCSNYSPSASSVHGIHQAGILEWVATYFFLT